MKKSLSMCILIALMLISAGCANGNYFCNGKITDLEDNKDQYGNHTYLIIVNNGEKQATFETTKTIYSKLTVGSTLNIRYDNYGNLIRFDYENQCKVVEIEVKS